MGYSLNYFINFFSSDLIGAKTRIPLNKTKTNQPRFACC